MIDAEMNVEGFIGMLKNAMKMELAAPVFLVHKSMYDLYTKEEIEKFERFTGAKVMVDQAMPTMPPGGLSVSFTPAKE